jgi:hypothetical protein
MKKIEKRRENKLVNMLYTIEVLEKKSRESPYDLVTDYRGLWNILWILNNAKNVSQFKVSCGAMTVVTHKEFGFGKLEKWVTKFDFKRSDEETIHGI